MLGSTAANGWIIAFAGVLLVYLCIKMVKKGATEAANMKEGKKSSQAPNERSPKDQFSAEIFPLNASDAFHFYLPLIEQMGDPFQLSDLYQLAREKKLPHPYLTVSSFRQNGFLLPKGDGLFTWNR